MGIVRTLEKLVFWTVVIVGGGIIAFVLWFYVASRPLEPDPECFARDVVLVKIGETVLAVPRVYRPVFHAPKGKKIPYDKATPMMYVCQRKGDYPVEVKKIWISPKNKLQKFRYVSLMNYNKRPTSNHPAYHVFEYDDYYVRYPFYLEEHDVSREEYQESITEEIEKWKINADFIRVSAQ